MEYELKDISLDDYHTIKDYYSRRRPETADSIVLNLFMWKDCYPTWYFTDELGLMWVAKSDTGQHYTSVPCCKDEDLKSCFLKIQDYFNDVLNKKLVMYLVDKKALDLLDLSDKDYVIVPDRTYADYVYDAAKLRTFSGKAYHKKKNHLNYFKKNYDGRYKFEFLNKNNLNEIMDFIERWKSNKTNRDEIEFVDCEAIGIKYILENEDIFDFKVGGVYVDGQLEAFTIGTYEEQEDMVYIPVEKANTDIRGLYQYICSEFLIQAFPYASKENREDDMGLEGLRKSKLSYNPIYLVEKYTIIQK